MKKISIILTILLVSKIIFAQNCTDADLENVPGEWEAGLKSSIFITGADLEKARNVTDIPDNMMRPGFQVPKGLVARYFSAFMGYSDNVHSGNDLAIYEYSNWFNHYMCYNDKITKNPDSQLILRISFNDPGVIFSRDVMAGVWEENEKDHFGWLDNFPDQKNGITFIKSTPDSAQFTYKPDRWLITYDGELPYAYVTQMEFLQKLKVKLEKSIERGVADIKLNNPVRPKAEQDREKQEALQKFKDEAAKGYGDWTDRYLQNYRTDEQIQEANIKSLTAMYQLPLNNVNEYLKKPESELQKTAVIDWNGDFDGFLKEGDVGAVILIKENPGYYNDKLPKAVPQVIFVSLTRYAGSKKENYVTVYKTIKERLDLEKLQAMIGK